MRIKKIRALLIIIALAVSVSGCAKIQPNNQLGIGQEKNGQEVAKDYEIIQRDDGWVTFKSHTCGFEISYPEKFEWSGHCEEEFNPYFFKKTYLSLGNFSSSMVNKNPFPNDGEMGLQMAEIRCINHASCENSDYNNYTIGEVVQGYETKSGTTTVYVEEIDIFSEPTYLVNKESLGPIEGPPVLNKKLYFNKGDRKYLLSSNIYYYDNEEMNDLFYEIIKTIRFVE